MNGRSKAKAAVLLIMGLILLGIGIYKLVICCITVRKPYTVVKGKITAYDREIRRVRYTRTVQYLPCLQFEYNGAVYAVSDPNGLSEEEKDSFNRYVGDEVEIRVPEGDPYSATLNYEASIYKKGKEGLKLIGLGAAVTVVCIMLMAF